MAINKIQLRGISRTPSDRMMQDGGCAECLNMQLDQDELVPMMPPRDIRSDEHLPGGGGYDILYIHQTAKYRHYICSKGISGRISVGRWIYIPSDAPQYTWQEIASFSAGTEIGNILSLGNTLGVNANGGLNWYIYKDGEYISLGVGVPFPKHQFIPQEVEGASVHQPDLANYSDEDPIGEVIDYRNTMVDEDDIYRAIREDSDVTDTSASFGQNRTKFEQMNDMLTVMLGKNRERGYFNNQVQAVLAIKLFDGSRIISTPCILGAGYEWPYDFRLAVEGYTSPDYTTTIKVKSNYKIWFKLNESQDFFSNYRDIVTGVEIYLSQRAVYSHYKPLRIRNYNRVQLRPDYSESTFELGSQSDPYEDEYLKQSNFYLVKSYGLSDADISSMTGGETLNLGALCMNEETLVQQERLDMLSDMTHYAIAYNESTIFNNKIIASQVSELTKIDVPYLQAESCFPSSMSTHWFQVPTPTNMPDGAVTYRVKVNYIIAGADGDETLMLGNIPSPGYMEYGTVSRMGVSAKSQLCAWAICPDARAKKMQVGVEFYNESGSRVGVPNVIELTMSRHPYLNVAYYYGGLSNNMISYDAARSEQFSPGLESLAEGYNNKLYVSAMDNPFVFPISGRHTFDYEIVASSTASVALSQGQFGQFPLYVFTTGGVWAMECNSLGEFLSSRPLNRHVAISGRMIAPVDGGVVFLTDAGVMLLQGSQVTDMSTNMIGRPWRLDNVADSSILSDMRNAGYTYILSPLTSTMSFMEFMRGASCAYDYAAHRLLFINTTQAYMYVLRLKTGSWHKLTIDEPGSATYLRSLNSYPRCNVVRRVNLIEAESQIQLLDFSTYYDDADDTTDIKGIIVTRPFDLERADVLKTIKRLRIRGDYDRYGSDSAHTPRVRYILLGSQDNIHFYRINTLRGKSWKLFRMIILLNVKQSDRISYVEIESEDRFANRMR